MRSDIIRYMVVSDGYETEEFPKVAAQQTVNYLKIAINTTLGGGIGYHIRRHGDALFALNILRNQANSNYPIYYIRSSTDSGIPVYEFYIDKKDFLVRDYPFWDYLLNSLPIDRNNLKGVFHYPTISFLNEITRFSLAHLVSNVKGWGNNINNSKSHQQIRLTNWYSNFKNYELIIQKHQKSLSDKKYQDRWCYGYTEPYLRELAHLGLRIPEFVRELTINATPKVVVGTRDGKPFVLTAYLQNQSFPGNNEINSTNITYFNTSRVI